MQPKALVTGANGMLADAFCSILKKNGYVVCLTDIVQYDSILYLDIRNLKMVLDFIEIQKPDIIFHLAAETDVDKCELNPEHAYHTNTRCTENIAIACKRYNIPLVYISTGAVFDGEKLGGYTEEDTPNPISVYGKSKLRGEEAVCSLLTKFYIIRAGWMIGGYNKDKKFVWKIIQQLNTKKEISVVTDKFGSPTFTKDFANGIISIISTGRYGVYHCVNEGICTRLDIAKKIAEYLNNANIVIKAVTSDYFSLPAPRGKSEALINHKLFSINMDNMRSWQEALKEYLEDIR